MVGSGRTLAENGVTQWSGTTWKRRTGKQMRWVGWLLVVAGVAVLGWCAWQFWGTSWLAQREHQQITDSLERQWEREPGGGRGGAQGVQGWPGDRVRAIVRIPAFGDDYAVPVLEGSSDDVLSSGFGHFAESAAAGRAGNYALAGHRVTHGEPLHDLPELDPGDEIVVETRQAVHTYALDTAGNALEVSFDATWVLDPVPTNPRDGGVQPPSQESGQRLITLTTCAELFHTDQRLIAFGHLVDTTRK